MKNEYIYKKAIEECNKRIENATALRAELNKIGFTTKKDGKPFKNIEKNITGAHIWHVSYLPKSCKHICLSAYVNGRYIDDLIALFKLVPDGYEQLTVEEVKEQIDRLNKSYTRVIVEEKRNIAVLEHVFNSCDEFIDKFKNEPYSMKAIIKKYIERSL